MNERRCHHCNEPVPDAERRSMQIDGNTAWFCCAGCEAVARLVLDAGLDDFYGFRTAPAPKVESADAARWAGFDEPTVLNAFAPLLPDGERELRLKLDDLRCAACGWLVEQALGREDGVCEVQLNVVTGRTRLRWKQEAVPLSRLLASLDALGFRPHPLREGEQISRGVEERKSFLKRLAVAGLGMMQVMMYGVAMYIGAFEDMDAGVQEFLRYVSLLIATPVVLYAAAPFFRGAWRDLVARRPGMDVPVALAIGAAYAASVWHVFSGRGEIYFDSVSMFVFFLLIGRFVEFAARHEVTESGGALAASLPAIAERLAADGVTTAVPLTALRAGDRVLVKSGDTVPADGKLLGAVALLDESLLTGEFAAVQRRAGDSIAAGAINRGNAFQLEIERTGRDTLLSGITRLLEQAQATRPRMARIADRLARWFVAGVLLAAAITAMAWYLVDAGRAFEITLAVLVVTCPCALALAVPVALTAATGNLARSGVLTVNSDALETLPRVTDVVFDKTGTLTRGKPQLAQVEVAPGNDREHCLAIAAALEATANHPLAAAFREHANSRISVTNVEQLAGQGVSGCVEGTRYWIGSPALALGVEDGTHAVVMSREQDGTREFLCSFELQDSLRDDAAETVMRLQHAGLRVHLFSGDAFATVSRVASSLGIESFASRMQPNEKLARVRAMQSEGRSVLMVGDGINDSPVLAGADISVAMLQGAALAQASADLVLAGSLGALPASIATATRAQRVMRQNLGWALMYNAAALPLAALGLVAPWMAAIGMSLSSLLVTLNALRLKSPQRDEKEPEVNYAAPYTSISPHSR